jgi:hypothetical protein
MGIGEFQFAVGKSSISPRPLKNRYGGGKNHQKAAREDKPNRIFGKWLRNLLEEDTGSTWQVV